VAEAVEEQAVDKEDCKMEIVNIAPPPEPAKTFYIQRWDNKGFTISARSYYRTESSYIFTNLTYTELKTHWHRGTLMEIPPVLEMDADSVLMIVDQEHYAATVEPEKPKRKRTTRTSRRKKT
jgi:hypothetical protein